MGQTLDIRAITQQDYSAGLELAKSAVKELYGIEKFNAIEFNFKVKNLFVFPGNVTRGIFVDNKMVGFVICSHNEPLWNDDKKLSIEFFYIDENNRTEENMNKIYAYVENYAYSNGYSSIRFYDSLPYVADHIKSFSETKKISTMYEKEVI